MVMRLSPEEFCMSDGNNSAQHTNRDWDADGPSASAHVQRGNYRIGPPSEEMLGHHANQWSGADMDSRAVDTPQAETRLTPELPELENEVYLIEPQDDSSRNRRQTVLGPLHGLVLDTALSRSGDAVWIDAQGHATTQTLTSVSPSERVLDRVHVARAFTAQQHQTLVGHVHQWLRNDADSPFGHPETDRPAVLVCPALDLLYRECELQTTRAKQLLTRAVAVSTAIARDIEIPVLTTRARTDGFSSPIEQAATTIELEQTRFGPQFECPALDFETVVYPETAGVVQTTLAFWQRVLTARHDCAGGKKSTQTASQPTAPPHRSSEMW